MKKWKSFLTLLLEADFSIKQFKDTNYAFYLSTIHQTCGLLFNIRLIISEYKLIITKAQFEENYASQIVPHIAIMFIE